MFGRNLAPKEFSLWRWALFALFCGTFVLNVYRASTQSLTVDEAFTYNNFVSPPAYEAFAHYDANNHVLNTLLCRLSVWLFGVSELTLRLPSLFGGAVYLLAVLWLSEWMFGAGLRAIVSFAALSANPIVLDYLSAARGYSLGLGFEFVAAGLVVIRLSGGRLVAPRLLNAAFGIALALSAAGNLVFAIPNLVLLLLFLFLLARSTSGLRLWSATLLEIALPGLIVFGVLMYFPLTHANVSNFYIGEASFSRSAEILLVRSFNHASVRWAEHLELPIARMAAPAILGSLLLLTILLAARKTPWPDNRWPVLLIFPATFVGTLATLVALHLLFGFPFPYERTGLYFIPLITFTVLVAAESGIRCRTLRIPGVCLYVYLCCVVTQYILELKANRYQEWASDAGTKRVVALLASMHKAQAGQRRLGISWEFEPSVSYYLKMYRVDWIEPVTRTDVRSGGFDYYYVTPDDRPVIDALKLNVLYVDPVSQAALAVPSPH
jgi:hypothetical protein